MKRRLLLACGLVALALCGPGAGAGSGTDSRVEIRLMRFFGSCEASVGTGTDAANAVGECAIITALVNRFNATNTDGIVVRTQVAEWGPYYDQLTARLLARDVPTVAVMHESLLGDYVRRRLLLPLDADFARLGIDTSDFTEQARRGVTFDGQTYALPFDTWSWLWHVNTGLFKRAGLLRADGSPILPRSPEQLLAQAEQFRRATGKPYFAWAVATESAANTRTFLTLVYQQNSKLFAPDGRSIAMHQPAVRRALQLMQQLYAKGHIKPNNDYGGANQSFLNGEAGVFVVGTWTIDQYLSESAKPESGLSAARGGGYVVRPFPQLFERPAMFADGHSWVLLKGGAPDTRSHEAALKLLKFLWDNDLAWARTGHLPTRQSIAASEEFKRLPFRSELGEVTRFGVAMPGNVPTQRAIERLIGEEIASLLISNKPIDQVIDDAEKRVNASLKRAHRGAPTH